MFFHWLFITTFQSFAMTLVLQLLFNVTHVQSLALSQANLHHDVEFTDRESGDRSQLWGPCAVPAKMQKLWPPVTEECLRTNVAYIKVPKAASTTFAGVVRRIAARNGVSGVQEEHWCSHASSKDQPMLCASHGHRRDLMQSMPRPSMPMFFFTGVRDPIERSLSDFYFRKAMGDLRNDGQHDSDLIDFLNSTATIDFQANYIRSKEDQPVPSILASFTVVGVAERFDESLILLRHALGIHSLCDFLYTNAKNSSSGKIFKTGKAFNRHIPLQEQSQSVKAFVASTEFQAKIATEYDLYDAASKRMDEQIKQIGKSRFDKELHEFQNLVEIAERDCADPDFKKCYFNDNGCGYKCLDDLCAAHNI